VRKAIVVGKSKEQIIVYYVSHALVEAEIYYPLIEKFAYMLVMASRKLLPYFKAHKVTAFSDQPLKNVVQRLDAYGQHMKSAVELS